MPTSRVFYESRELFPVFAQWLPKTVHGNPLELLEQAGHYGLGHLSYVNPANPRLAPRMTISKETLASLSSWESLIDYFGKKPLVCIDGQDELTSRYLIHTLAGSRFPDQILYRVNDPYKYFDEVCNRFEVASELGLLKGKATSLENIGAVIVQRPDLSREGQRLDAHSIASLAGFHPEQANNVFKEMKNDDLHRLIRRILKFSGHRLRLNKVIKQFHSLHLALNPLSHFWVIDRDCIFIL